MNEPLIRKYALDKIALLGFVVAGLLAAQLIVSARSKIRFAQAAELPQSGLKIVVPVGQAWNTDKSWQFNENILTLKSSLSPMPGRITTAVELSYFLAPLSKDTDDLLAFKQAELPGSIVKTGQVWLGQFALKWVQIRPQNGLFDRFIGVAALPNGRIFTIEVRQIAGRDQQGELIFQKITQSLEFEDNLFLAKGISVVEAFISRGVRNITGKQPEKDFFLVGDARDRTVGFLADAIAVFGGGSQAIQLRTVDVFRIKTINAAAGGHSLFQCDNKMSTFTWLSNLSGFGASRYTVKIALSPESILTVTTLPPPGQRKYAPTQAAVPEPLLDYVIAEMLQQGQDKMIVDVIMSTGRIIPTLASQIEPADTDEPAARYIVRLDFLDGLDYYQMLYFDADRRVFKALVQQAEKYLIRRCTEEKLLETFPSQRDYIMQMQRILMEAELVTD